MLRELRLAIRGLRRAPGLAVVSILTVALGVGAGTSLFSVVKAVLLNPLPYPDADRLAWIAGLTRSGHETQVSYPDFADLRRENRTFLAMAAYNAGAVNAGSDLPQRTEAAAVSRDFFDVAGLPPVIGRSFLPEEHIHGAAVTVVLGYGLWQRAYGGDRRIIGRSIRISGLPATVIGIMPPRFSFPDGAELWMPLAAFGDPTTENRTAHNFR